MGLSWAEITAQVILKTPLIPRPECPLSPAGMIFRCLWKLDVPVFPAIFHFQGSHRNRLEGLAGTRARSWQGCPLGRGRSCCHPGIPTAKSEPGAKGFQPQSCSWLTVPKRDGNILSEAAVLNGQKTDLYINPTGPPDKRKRAPALDSFPGTAKSCCFWKPISHFADGT